MDESDLSKELADLFAHLSSGLFSLVWKIRQTYLWCAVCSLNGEASIERLHVLDKSWEWKRRVFRSTSSAMQMGFEIESTIRHSRLDQGA